MHDLPIPRYFEFQIAITPWLLWLELINYIPFERKFYELQEYVKIFWKFSKFWALGGIFENFKNPSNSLIFNFLEQTNISFERSWREEQDSGVIFHFLWWINFFRNFLFFFIFGLKLKNDLWILFLSSRPFKWYFCLFQKVENEGIRRIFEIFENSPQRPEFRKFSKKS